MEPRGLGKGPRSWTYKVTSWWLADAGTSGAQKRDPVTQTSKQRRLLAGICISERYNEGDFAGAG